MEIGFMYSEIILIIITSLSVIVGSFAFYWALRTRKRQERTIYTIKRENEALNYYLKTEIPQNVQDRYLQNLNSFNISNFDYDNIDRLMFEMRKLRSDIRKLNDSKFQKNIQTINKIDDKNFNYNELIFQISNMTNIQNLFESALSAFKQICLFNTTIKLNFKYIIQHLINNPKYKFGMMYLLNFMIHIVNSEHTVENFVDYLTKIINK